MKTTLSPLRSLIEIVDDELVAADEAFATLVAGDPMVQRLTTLPGIGPITASAFVAALDTASRFERANQVASYLGLVPQNTARAKSSVAVASCAVRNRTCSHYSCKPPGGYGVRRILPLSFRTWARRSLAGAEKSRHRRPGPASRPHAVRDVARSRPTINRDERKRGANVGCRDDN